MEFNYNNGGNPKGVNDCVTRAIAIALKCPYYDVAQSLAPFMEQGGVNVNGAGFLSYMQSQGFKYVRSLTPMYQVPPDCIAHTPSHYTAVVSGIANDVIDVRHEIVRGYWLRGSLFNVVTKGMAINTAPMNFEQAIKMRTLYALNYSRKTEIQCYIKN